MTTTETTATRFDIVRKLIAMGIYRSMADVSRNAMNRCDNYLATIKNDVATEPMLHLVKHLNDEKKRPDLADLVFDHIMRSI